MLKGLSNYPCLLDIRMESSVSWISEHQSEMVSLRRSGKGLTLELLQTEGPHSYREPINKDCPTSYSGRLPRYKRSFSGSVLKALSCALRQTIRSVRWKHLTLCDLTECPPDNTGEPLGSWLHESLKVKSEIAFPMLREIVIGYQYVVALFGDMKGWDEYELVLFSDYRLELLSNGQLPQPL